MDEKKAIEYLSWLVKAHEKFKEQTGYETFKLELNDECFEVFRYVLNRIRSDNKE